MYQLLISTCQLHQEYRHLLETLLRRLEESDFQAFFLCFFPRCFINFVAHIIMFICCITFPCSAIQTSIDYNNYYTCVWLDSSRCQACPRGGCTLSKFHAYSDLATSHTEYVHHFYLTCMMYTAHGPVRSLCGDMLTQQVEVGCVGVVHGAYV